MHNKSTIKQVGFIAEYYHTLNQKKEGIFSQKEITEFNLFLFSESTKSLPKLP